MTKVPDPSADGTAHPPGRLPFAAWPAEARSIMADDVRSLAAALVEARRRTREAFECGLDGEGVPGFCSATSQALERQLLLGILYVNGRIASPSALAPEELPVGWPPAAVLVEGRAVVAWAEFDSRTPEPLLVVDLGADSVALG